MATQEKLISDKRDWSDLPSNLVYIIARKLPRFFDYVHVHFTCKSWQSSTPLSDFPSHIPWLLEFHQKPNDYISMPTSWFRGSANSYLPIIDNSTNIISLFNPLTNDEFDVPLPHNPHKSYSSYTVGTELGPIRKRRILIVDHCQYWKGFDRWVIFDPNNGSWRKQEGHCILSCYCQGMFFTTIWEYGTPKTVVLDASSRNLLYTIPPHEDDITNVQATQPVGQQLHSNIRKFTSYVAVSSGEIWRVNWYCVKDAPTKSKFKLYRLSFEGSHGQPCWVKITNIGDEIIFLERTNDFSLAVNGFSISAASANGLIRRGFIYFIDPYKNKPYVYHFASSTGIIVPCPFEKCTWFRPGLC